MNFWEKIKLFFVRVGSTLKKVLGPILGAVSRKVFDELLAFALDVCQSLDCEDITNEEKRKQAYEEIKENAISRGVVLKSSLISLLIELAVAYLHSVNNKE